MRTAMKGQKRDCLMRTCLQKVQMSSGLKAFAFLVPKMNQIELNSSEKNNKKRIVRNANVQAIII